MKCEIYNDNFQNYKRYGISKAQLVIADIPYNIGSDAYGSNPMWYKGGDNKNGESRFAKKAFLTLTGGLELPSTCISVQSCLSRNRKNAEKPRP